MTDFATLGLSQPIVDAVSEMGFVTPTPIQAQAIPKLLESPSDLVGLAQTGTGKTAAFGLPLLDLIDIKEKHTQALVLAPTRELCLQISNELNSYSKKMKGLKIQAVYGGTDIHRQISSLRKGAHIITATPGRLRDLIRRRAVNISTIGYVVLDEADEMLNMGFKEEIDDILSNTPDEKITWLFSATMPDDVRRIARNYMDSPLEISVGQRNSSNQNIAHQYVVTHPSDRFDVLKRFLDYDTATFGVVFCRTRRDTMELSDSLTREGYSADALHGDLSQAQRDRVMSRFRNKQLQVLVATDVAARGIDVQDISHVFHFNIPEDISFYTHRSGRTGRAGKKGVSLILCHPKDRDILRRIERRIKIEINETTIPTGTQVCEQMLKKHLSQLQELELNDQLAEFMPTITEELESYSKEELIQRFATLSFKSMLDRYADAPDLNRGSRRRRSNDSNMQQLFINVGQMDMDNKGSLLSFICGTAQIPGSAIGKIDMRRTHSVFAVDGRISKKIKEAFRNADFEGRSLRVNDLNGRDRGGNGGGQRDRKRRKRSPMAARNRRR